MEEGVYLLKINFINVRSFISEQLDLASNNGRWKQWTVILGNNSTGKTTILQTIASAEVYKGPGRQPDYIPEFNRMDEFNIFRDDDENYLLTVFDDDKHKTEVQLFTNVSGYREADIELTQLLYFQKGYASSNKLGIEKLLIYGYSANRFTGRKSLSDSKSKNSATLFDDDAKLINAEEWLIQLDYSAKSSNNYELISFFSKRRELIIEILKTLLPDIENIRFTEPTKEVPKIDVEFQTPYGWVTIQQLSLGYKTMVAWMVDLAARLFERYPDSDNPLAEPAIVLVDEIDLHMHPKWQRKIFDYLSEKFPKTQFIVTAHSPLIVQSAPKDANIVLLRREGDHVVIDNDIKSVHNWRIDQILNSDLFGNIPQLPPDEEKWMDEREELLKKEKLSKEEKKRLKELEEKVDQMPTADNQRDIEAMEIIRKAAQYLKTQNA